MLYGGHRRRPGRPRRPVRRARRAHDRADGAPRRAPRRRRRRSASPRLRGRLRDHRRRTSRPPSTPGHRRSARATWCWSARGWGRLFGDERPARYIGHECGVPGRRRGRRDVAGRAQGPRRRRRHHRLRAPRARRRARAAAGAPRAPGRARHLHHRGDATWRSSPAAGVHEFTFVLVAAAPSSARPARRSGRWRWSRRERTPTLGPAAGRLRGRRPPSTTLPADGRRTASAAGCSTSLGHRCVAALPLRDQRRRRSLGGRRRAAAAEATAVGVPDRLPAALAAFVNGVLAHSLDYDDTHLPSVLHPSARVVPAALAAAEASRRVGGRALVARRRRRAGGLRPPRHGRLRPGRSATRSSSSTASTPPRSAARWAARWPPRCCCGLDARRASRRARRRRVHGAPASSRRTAPAARVKRMHCGWAAHAARRRRGAGPRRLHRSAHRPRGAVRLLPGVAARRVRRRRRSSTGSGETGRCRASSSSRTRPTTSPTPAIDAALALRARGIPPEDVERAELGVAAPDAAHDRRADRGRSGARDRRTGPVQRAVRRRGGAARRRRARRRRSTTSPTTLARDPARRALMAEGRRRAPTTGATAIFPHQFPAVLRPRTARRPRTGRRGADQPGRPERPLSDEELAPQVPRQRRTPCCPARTPTGTSQRPRLRLDRARRRSAADAARAAGSTPPSDLTHHLEGDQRCLSTAST